MSQKSKIQWTENTWPIVTGCRMRSPGCLNCYAIKDSWRLSHNPNPKISEPYKDTVVKDESGKLKWSNVVKCHPERLGWVLQWKKPSMVFVSNMADLFDADVPDEFIDQVWAHMAIASHHQFQVLTKEPERMKLYLRGGAKQRIRRATVDLGRELNLPHEVYLDFETCQFDWPLNNVWVGTSVENQAMANKRIRYLLETPAAVRFLSCEPLLGELDLSEWLAEPLGEGICDVCEETGQLYALDSGPVAGAAICTKCCPRLDWVITGGESQGRPCHQDWLRSVVQQCQRAKVKVFVKQLGSYSIEGITDVKVKLKDRKGGDINEFPNDLQIRQFPEF